MLIDLLENKDTLIDLPIVREERLNDFSIPFAFRKKLREQLQGLDYSFGPYTSVQVTQDAKPSSPANFAILPNQYFVLACEFHDLAKELKKYFDYFDMTREFSNLLLGDAATIEKNIRSQSDLTEKFATDDDIPLFSKFMDKTKNNPHRFSGKRLINDAGVPRSSADCFSSVILNLTNLATVTSSSFGHLVWNLVCHPKLYSDLKLIYSSQTQNSIVVCQDKHINSFARMVFEHFHNADWQALLTACDVTKRGFGENNFDAFHYKEFKMLIGKFEGPQTAETLKSGKPKRFFENQIFNDSSGYYYFSNQWNGEGDRPLSFANLKRHFEEKHPRYSLLMQETGYKLLQSTNGGVQEAISLPKPFVLLAGISGTGKTRFVRQQAQASSLGNENFCLVPVRPDWHEPSDLLGYVSRISGKPEYVSTKVLQFIIRAWKVAAPNASIEGMGELNWDSEPFWLCLDEMNLAPVEQYFADYLSVLESRDIQGNQYQCDPLLDKTVLEINEVGFQKDLKLEEDKELWEYFLSRGIHLTPNLIVAGTVNMDETTHGFSRKVIDRAITLDFGEFFPNDYESFFGGQAKPKTLTYNLNSQATLENLDCDADVDGNKTIKFLSSVNKVLSNTPFELAYRALNELLLHVSCFSPSSEAELQAVWDDFLMTKVLPRIDGDQDKLRVPDSVGSENLLESLESTLAIQLDQIWDDGKERIDLMREKDGAPISDIACRSKKKIRWMKGRLEANTFTSFWP